MTAKVIPMLMTMRMMVLTAVLVITIVVANIFNECPDNSISIELNPAIADANYWVAY